MQFLIYIPSHPSTGYVGILCLGRSRYLRFAVYTTTYTETFLLHKFVSNSEMRYVVSSTVRSFTHAGSSFGTLHLRGLFVPKGSEYDLQTAGDAAEREDQQPPRLGPAAAGTPSCMGRGRRRNHQLSGRSSWGAQLDVAQAALAGAPGVQLELADHQRRTGESDLSPV